MPGFHFPNFFKITDVQILSNILSIIIGALSSILAIIIAVILVIFEILQKKYEIHAYTTIFKNKRFIELISLYILTILTSFYSLITLSNPLSNINISFSYFSIGLFTVSIIILFPYSYNIITLVQSKDEVRMIVSQIDHSKIQSLGIFRGFIPTSSYLLQTENNPFNILVNIGIKTLRNDDTITPKFIITETFSKIKDLLKNYPGERRNIINSFGFILNNIANEAIKLSSLGTLLLILNIIKELHRLEIEVISPFKDKTVIKEKLKWDELIELNEFTINFINKNLNSGLDEIVKNSLYAQKDIIEIHLNDLRNFLIKNTNVKEDNEYLGTIVFDGYIRNYANIIEKAIDLDRREIYQTGLLEFGYLVSSIFNILPTTQFKKNLIGLSTYFMKSLTLKSIKKSSEPLSPFFPFNHLSLQNSIERDKELSKILIQAFGSTLVELGERNALDYYILNEFGTFGRYCAGKIKEDIIFYETIMYIGQIFNKIREIIQDNYNNKNSIDYINVHKQLSSIIQWVKNKDEKSKKVISFINDLLQKFNLLKGFQNRVNKGYIQWPKL